MTTGRRAGTLYPPAMPRALTVLALAALLLTTCSRGSADDPATSASPTATTTGATAAASPPYARTGWPTIHADGANSDSTEVMVTDELSMLFRTLEGLVIGAVLTVAGDGSVLVTTSSPGPDSSCHVRALEPTTGAVRWCNDSLGPGAVSSSVLADREGNLYVGDAAHMFGLDAAGGERWRTPIDGAPLSAQLLGDGSVVFVTHVGHVYVVDPESGAIIADEAMLPGVSAAGVPSGCLRGDATGTCYGANTVAVDASTNDLYFTLTRPVEAQEAPVTSVVALTYGAKEGLRPKWDAPVLEGGSAASPTLGADGHRLYANDRRGDLLALDTANGEVAWRFALDYTPAGSPSVSRAGVIVPSGGVGGRVIALRDAGDSAEILWQRDDLRNRGVIVQTGDGTVLDIAADPGALGESSLVLLDGATGQTRAELALPGLGAVTIGTTVDAHGRLFVAGLTTGIIALGP